MHLAMPKSIEKTCAYKSALFNAYELGAESVYDKCRGHFIYITITFEVSSTITPILQRLFLHLYCHPSWSSSGLSTIVFYQIATFGHLAGSVPLSY